MKVSKIVDFFLLTEKHQQSPAFKAVTTLVTPLVVTKHRPGHLIPSYSSEGVTCFVGNGVVLAPDALVKRDERARRQQCTSS
jgi:adenylosuccinate synthase